MIWPDNESTRKNAAELVSAGGVIGFRTDTFYGLGADPFNERAVERINELKGRDNKPILLLISDRSQVDRVIESQSIQFELLAKEFWPGPLTIIGAAVKDLPKVITAGSGTVGVRLPDDEDVRSLVALCGGVLTATSANPAGKPPSETAEQVEDYFSNRIDLVIDGGTVTATQPSTVVDATQNIRIVREGAVSRAAVERIMNQGM